MTETVRLHLRLLGPFAATVHTPDGQTVTRGIAASRPLVKVAFGVLAYDGHPGFTVEVDRLSRILWEKEVDGPGEEFFDAEGIPTHKTGEEIARSRLTHLLTDMRKMLGGGSDGKLFVERSEATVKLLATSVDLVDFGRQWDEGRYEEAREIAERGAFLAGVPIQTRNESAQRWLESAREDWSLRIEGLFQAREAEHAEAGEGKEAALWAAARRKVAHAHGLTDLAEKAQQAMRRYEANGATHQLGSWGAEQPSESLGRLPAELDALAASRGSARVALLCGDASVRRTLHESAAISTNGLELSLPKGTSRPFDHGGSLRAALADATHCFYVLAEEEHPDSGWGAFSAALATEAGVPFQAVSFAGEEAVR